MQQLILFLSQLATLLKNHIPILKAFSIIESSLHDDKWQLIIKKIKHDMQQGGNLDKSFVNHIPNLHNFVVNMIKIGEISNSRHICLELAAKYLKTKFAQRKQLMKQLVYPGITLTTALFIIILMQHLIIPNILNFYQTLSLPIPNSITIFRNVVTTLECSIIIFGVIVIILIVFRKHLPNIQLYYQKILFNFPVVGYYIKLNFCYNFCLSFTMLLRCKQTISEALQHLNSQNFWPQHLVMLADWNSQLNSGVRLSEVLANSLYLPKIVPTQIAIAEESGELLSGFSYLTQHFKTLINEFFANINRWLEPTIVLLLGLIIGIVSLCIYYPIFQISSSL